MAVLPIGMSGEEAGGYQIERSLRFNSADSAYLSRTPASAGNKKTFTISLWIKRSALGATTALLDGDSSDGNRGEIYFDSSDRLNIYDFYVASGGLQIFSQRVFRDVGAWMHIVFAFDTTQATDSNRLKIYVNGVQENLANWSVGSGASRYPTQNADFSWNGTTSHWIGRTNSGSAYFNGYLSEIYNIDGQALDPTSFGEYNSETGVWQPKAYTGSYGTNGFYLDFADNSSTTALGYDAAGSNDWTPNNFSVTAGAGNDSLVDTPTPYGTDTGVGAEVRGNYATLNPLTAWRTTKPVNGNLEFSSGSDVFALGTMPLYAGKWYCEVKILGGVNEHNVGFVNLNSALTSSFPSTATIRGSNAFALYSFDGKFYNNGTASASLATFAANDIIMLAYDADNSKIYVGRNGTWLNSAVPASGTGAVSTTATAPLVVATQSDAGDATGQQWNFGQRPFAYTAPSGFKALCTQNLPEPTVVDGGEYFNPVLYTGNGSTQSITGVGFQPDLVWAKCRSNSYHHKLVDAVRGATLTLSSSQTAAEQTETNSLTAFNSDGFSLGSISSMNASAETFVAWNWKAGGTGVSNTAGSITSTVSANTTAGFSIVTYSGQASVGTVGHGLGVAPAMIIVKNRNQTYNWSVYHKNLTSAAYALLLNTTGAEFLSNAQFNSTAPTSSVFTVGTGGNTNSSGDTFVAYCFAPVEGYSAFGSFSTNGSADGPFIYTGFTPRWILMKYSNTTSYWLVMDTARNTYNVVTQGLRPNTSDADSTALFAIDILSNGFKPRDGGGLNGAGNTTIYAAFAESPFKYSLGR